MDPSQRIAQFENMVQADPENDMGWFSLGNAYAQAGRPAEAAAAYLRCCALNKSMSKAYQLAGQQLVLAKDDAKAAEVLTEGYRVAAEKGDFMPRKAMGELLEKLGQPLPQVMEAKPAGPAPDGSFICWRTRKAGTKMPRPPFRGPLGIWIHANIARETFMEGWIPQGTKVINELRLDLSKEEDAATYDRHMRDYLGIDEELLAKIMTETASA